MQLLKTLSSLLLVSGLLIFMPAMSMAKPVTVKGCLDIGGTAGGDLWDETSKNNYFFSARARVGGDIEGAFHNCSCEKTSSSDPEVPYEIMNPNACLITLEAKLETPNNYRVTRVVKVKKLQ